jgi:hypothetical protein
MQREILREALALLVSAPGPRTTRRSAFEWRAEDPGWRARYNHVDPADRERLLAEGDERRRKRGQAPRRTSA